MKGLIPFLAILLFISHFCDCKRDPYKVLGVKRSATTQEIRSAYRNLAKEWHPDKNNSPDAQAKFVEINGAYEILSDAEKRKRYDQHGIVDDQQGRHPEWNHHFRRPNPFDFFDDDFFGGGGGRFHFGGGRGPNVDPGLYNKQSITGHQYYNEILPESTVKPYIILFYSDWCFTCLRIEPIWAKLTDELEPVGFGVITVHAGRQRELARKIGSNELPHIALLFDGKTIHYKDPQFSALRILDFVRSKLPYKLVEIVDSGNVDNFLKGWHDNRIRVLLFGKTEVIRLRYLTTAFKFRQRAKIGYVRIDDLLSRKIVSKYNVPKNKDTMLVFHEDSDHPVAVVSMQDLALKTLYEVIETHQFLTLPRLSSQVVMDQLCPSDSSKVRKRLCVLLINDGKDHSIPEEEQKRSLLRSFILSNDFERVRFAYVFKDIQSDFVQALTDKGQNNQDLNLAIVWRKGAKKLHYEWFKQVWSSSHDEMIANKTEDELKATLQRLLSPNEILSHEAVLQELLDEHATSLPFRIIYRILDTWDWLRDNLSKDEILPTISLIGALAFVVIMSQCLQYAVAFDEEDSSNWQRQNPNQRPVELKLIEFKAETYNGLLRLLRPGCRTMVLVLSRETKDKLAPKFFKTMWPYRKNKTLNFAYMFIEKGQSWFLEILQQASDAAYRDQNINPRNVIGTVLALNGHRRYFCMYHAKHPEGQRHAKGGSFLGFDDDESDEELDPEMNLRQRLINDANKPIRQDELLDGLPLWLDRLFEGSTQRYYINYWPEFPIYDSNLGARRHMHAD